MLSPPSVSATPKLNAMMPPAKIGSKWPEVSKLLLELEGHEVHTVHGGQEALDAAREFRPDVALLDIGMPRMNGYEAARRIRSALRDEPDAVYLLDRLRHTYDQRLKLAQRAALESYYGWDPAPDSPTPEADLVSMARPLLADPEFVRLAGIADVDRAREAAHHRFRPARRADSRTPCPPAVAARPPPWACWSVSTC